MQASLKQFRYFIAVANAGQISRAAKEIKVSQSAITTAIKNLEESVGALLLERHPTGIALTYEGHLFLDHAHHVVAAADEAIRLPRRVREDVEGELKLAISNTVSGYFLPPALARFKSSFPKIDVKLSEINRNLIEEGLITNDFDLAVMLTSNLVNHQDLEHAILMRSRRRLWLSANHPLLDQPAVSLKDIANENYIMLSADESSNSAQRYWNKSGCSPNISFKTNSVEAVRSFVANGLGITILSDMLYRPWSLEGRRVEVLSVTDPIPTLDIGMVWSKGSELEGPARAFAEFMHLAMGAEQKVLPN